MVFCIENENQIRVRITKPRSRENLKKITKQIREKLGIDRNQLFVNILYCLEILIPKLDCNFHYEIFEKTINTSKEASFSPKKIVYIFVLMFMKKH